MPPLCARYKRTMIEKYYSILLNTSLFSGLSRDELLGFLQTLNCAQRYYEKAEVLIMAGQPSRNVGIVLYGSIEALHGADNGTPVPITRMGVGGVFSDVLSGSTSASPVTVIARTDCEVLWIPYDRLLLGDKDSASSRRVLQNLVRTISDKYFLLSRRVDLLVMKTLRAKVCCYLLSESERAGSTTFTIPFTRVQLADYLHCDRSALSRELGMMQKEGLLDTYRSSFKLLNVPALRRCAQ